MHRWATRNAILHTTCRGPLCEGKTQTQAVCGEYSQFARVRTALLWRNWSGCTAVDESPLTVIYWWQIASDVMPARVTTIAKAAICRWTWPLVVQDNSSEWRSAVQWYCFWTVCSLGSCRSMCAAFDWCTNGRSWSRCMGDVQLQLAAQCLTQQWWTFKGNFREEPGNVYNSQFWLESEKLGVQRMDDV